MKRIQTISIALGVLAMISALVPLRAYLQTAQRGQTVRIPVENGKEITLYNRSYALVIGASIYTNGWPRLPGVQRDVTEVRTALEAHGFTVETLLNPTRDNFDRTIRRFISRYAQAPDNRILIYFAGHGHTIRTEDNVELGYIVPVDAPDPVRNGNAAFKEIAISMSEIDGYARQIESKHALFVFDSCFSGSIFDATRAVPPVITEKTTRPVRQFITAGTAEQAVPDKSIFRQQFVEALKGEGDLSKDGFITGSELGFYLEDKVANYTERAQTPQWGKIRNPNLDKGDFVFALPRRIVPAPPTAAPTPRLDPEEEAWKIVAVTKSPEVVREFLNAYPSGRYAANARIKLKEMDSISNVRERPPANTAENKAAGNNTSPSSTVSITLTPIIPLPSNVSMASLSLLNFTTASVDGNGRVRKYAGTMTQQYAEDLGGGVKLEMVAVKGNGGIHDFWMGKYEVTQAQWRAVMAKNPSYFKDDRLPVERVSWDDIKKFCRRLNDRLGLSEGEGYRLPREAEWEYAARAGTRTEYAFGNKISPEIVNYDGEYPYSNAPISVYNKRTLEVGGLGVANVWGLYDMHGNVGEWCEDLYEVGSSYRAIRGGSWNLNAQFCGSAHRHGLSPGIRSLSTVGFRLARSVG